MRRAIKLAALLLIATITFVLVLGAAIVSMIALPLLWEDAVRRLTAHWAARHAR